MTKKPQSGTCFFRFSHIAIGWSALKSVELSLLLAAVTISTGWAALPPWHQNSRDLEVMVGFINQHPEVSMTLRLIDFSDFTVHYGDQCVASFVRTKRFRLPGWAGPKEPLKFQRSTCLLQSEFEPKSEAE